MRIQFGNMAKRHEDCLACETNIGTACALLANAAATFLNCKLASTVLLANYLMVAEKP